MKDQAQGTFTAHHISRQAPYRNIQSTAWERTHAPHAQRHTHCSRAEEKHKGIRPSFLRSTSVTLTPVLPARPVRPLLWMYVSGSCVDNTNPLSPPLPKTLRREPAEERSHENLDLSATCTQSPGALQRHTRTVCGAAWNTRANTQTEHVTRPAQRQCRPSTPHHTFGSPTWTTSWTPGQRDWNAGTDTQAKHATKHAQCYNQEHEGE